MKLKRLRKPGPLDCGLPHPSALRDRPSSDVFLGDATAPLPTFIEAPLVRPQTSGAASNGVNRRNSSARPSQILSGLEQSRQAAVRHERDLREGIQEVLLSGGRDGVRSR
jgi:hypothetical protein